MKRIYVIELFANIRATIISFLSIAMFVAMGIAAFLGLRWGGTALSRAVDSVLEATSFADVEVDYPYGLDPSDIAEISSLEGVEDVEVGYVTFAQTPVNNAADVLRVQSLTPEIGVPQVIEGRLPQDATEIAIIGRWAWSANVGVGDQIVLDESSSVQFLANTTYRVVGIVRSPGYLAMMRDTYGVSTIGSGAVDGVAFVTPDAFNQLMFLSGWPCVYVRCAEARGLSSFSKEYGDTTNELAKRIEEIGQSRSKVRFGTVQDFLQAVVDYGEEITKNRPDLLEAVGVEEDVVEGIVGTAGAFLGSMRDTGWIVLDHYGNGGLLLAYTFVDILGKLCYTMAALFVLVGLMVCYSAISRIVYEHIVQIGTKKALGFHSKEITGMYLAYAGLAVVLGTAVGAAAAVWVVQAILEPPLANCFVLGRYPTYFSLLETLVAGGVELALILLATWLSCRGVLRRSARDLLQGGDAPEVKQRFFESWKVWQRMPLLGQTIVNNCLNDKRRMVGTLVGVAGCTALVVSAFTLQQDVLGSYDRQFETEFSFDATAVPYAGASLEAAAEIEGKGCRVAPVVRKNSTIKSKNRMMTFATLTCPLDEEAFLELYHLHPTDGSVPDLSREGVWVTDGFARNTGSKVGDEVWVRGPDNAEVQTTIAGIFDYYLIGSEMVMGAETYRELFDIDPMAVAGSLIVDTQGMGATSLRASLAGSQSVAYVSDFKASAQAAFVQFGKVSQTVVLLYIGLSVLMAVVVLLNLNTMYVEEKKRELIVLRIIGFSVGDAKGYVRNDTIVLTVVGILIGMVVGSFMGVLTVGSVEPLGSRFLHVPNLFACLMGAVVSAVLSLLVGYISLRRVAQFDLTDINRF